MIRSVQTNFTSGMLDAKVRDHIDLLAYRNGAEEISNCRLLPQGGVTRRPGLDHLATIPTAEYQVEPFIFSASQAYTFLFWNGKVDIWNKNTRTLLGQLSGPWTEAQIVANELRVEQQLDKMFVSHGDFETQVITRTGASTFTMAPLVYDRDPSGVIVYQPYHKYAPSTSWLEPSSLAVGAAFVVSATSSFTAAHVGTKIRYRKKQMTVTSFINDQSVNVTIDEALPSPGGKDYDWDEQAFSAVHGWIRSLCLHMQRLWIGGGRDCPNVVWGSSLDGPFNYDLGTGADDDAIKYPIYAKRVAEIISMVSNGYLQIFCGHGEFYVPKPDSQALTPASFAIEPQSIYGSAALQARQFDQTTIFITRKAKGMREFNYDAQQTSFAADTLTFMSKTLLSGPRDLDVQMEGEDEEQESRAFVVNDDGTIAVLSKVKKENISGWAFWTTNGRVRRLGVVDAEVWAIVERTLNGVVSIHLELFDMHRMLDFSTFRTGASSNVWGPFPLYNGLTVHAISGDLYLGEIAVGSDNMLYLPTAVTQIEIGFNFVPRVIPLQQHVQLPDGITMGEPKRYTRCIAQLAETLSCQIKNRHLPGTRSDEDPGLAPKRFTGDFEAWLLGWSVRRKVVIVSPYPLPFTLNTLVTEVEV